MNEILAQEYGLIPEFFSKQCKTLGLPLATVVSHTQGFVEAIVGLGQIIDRINMHRYIEPIDQGVNYLFCYLRSTGLSPEESGRIAKEVLDGLRKAGVPLSSREKAQ
ncbi:hypothetical protein KA057_04150 [Candidatus Gracilibacteria bacterium]|nr:hypothetical protein [Candidatus Gracilibacteria bacterium]